MSRNEEKLKKLLLEIDQKRNENLNGIFFFGFIIGIITSFSGLLGIISGLFLGFIISSYYQDFSNKIVRFISNMFNQYMEKYRQNMNEEH